MFGLYWRLKQCSAPIQASIVFLAVFFGFIPISFYGENHRSFINNNAFFSAVNSLFVAEYGMVWVSGAFWLHAFSTGFTGDKEARILYFKNRTLVFVLHMINLVAFNLWFFGSSLIDRLNVAMGGHCSGSDFQSLSISACRTNPDSDWTDGFDLSGHYFFIVTSILVLVDHIFLKAGGSCGESEFYYAQTRSIISELEKRTEQVLASTRRFAYVLIAIWFLEFCITSIFFHTVWEKAVGLIGIPIALGTISLSRVIMNLNFNASCDIDEVSTMNHAMA